MSNILKIPSVEITVEGLNAIAALRKPNGERATRMLQDHPAMFEVILGMWRYEIQPIAGGVIVTRGGIRMGDGVLMYSGKKPSHTREIGRPSTRTLDAAMYLANLFFGRRVPEPKDLHTATLEADDL